MAAVSDSAYAAILRGIGVPDSPINIATLKVWQKYEGGRASFNPFNTNRPAPGATRYNSAGVKNYPDEATGITATVGALKLPYYVFVRAALKTQQPPAVGAAIIASPWGTKNPAMVAEMAALPGKVLAGTVVEGAKEAVAGPAKNFIELAARGSNLMERLTRKETWVRVGLFVLGAALVIYGLFLFFREPIGKAVQGVSGIATTVATKGKVPPK